MEIGSFIELEFQKNKEWYNGDKYNNMDVVRLNSGRAAIYHAVRCLQCSKVYLPYYQCNTVRDFLKRKGIEVAYYYIDSKFNPLINISENNTAILFVNYYGVMSETRMAVLASKYKNVIIDNSQAFFSKPILGCMNIYSARKFIGVPDGAYVIGEGAANFMSKYKQGYSSDTSLFLLQRIEYGCEGKAYSSRTLNENRINKEDIMKMSKLTHTILDGTDYEFIINKRQENFRYAVELFETVNLMNPLIYFSEGCIPMVYPLVVEDDELIERLQMAKHFQGHWWSYLCKELQTDKFEYWLSRYIIPITIDQRYSKKDIERLRGLI